MYENKPWRDEEVLRELYHGEGMTQKEIADEFDIIQPTVSKWFLKLDIESRDSKYPELCDKKWLQEQYIKKQKSFQEIADDVGCSTFAVQFWLDKHDIETRSANIDKPPTFFTRKDGYEEIRTQFNDDQYHVLVHRLVAVAQFGYEKVSDMHVHHESGIQWDNRPDNLSLVTNSEHGKLHEPERERNEEGDFL